ncbi:MAG: magnesium transporter [Verrucomicrobia bacterium]|nr:magnesium transporter [Verrucomicrobiota bacterium]
MMAYNDFSRLVKDCAAPVHTVLNQDLTIEEALAGLRGKQIHDKIIYFYVVDGAGRLQGVVPTRKLLLADPKSLIKEVMAGSVVHVQEDQSLAEAMQLLTNHELLALPVVDQNQCLKGIIDVQLYLEESLDIANRRHQADVFQILGLTLEEGKNKSTWRSYRTRMPWIFCNMFGGIACALISRWYEGVLGKVLLLAMFIPLVLTLSESISMQSMTQSLHVIRQKRLSWRRIMQQLFAESRLALALALTCGAAVGGLSLFWEGGKLASLLIGVSIFLSITLSALMGAAIPLILYARSYDPKVAAGPVVLMLADILTTGIYLSLATWILL